MRLRSRLLVASFAMAFASTALPCHIFAQEPGSATSPASAATPPAAFPEAPQPQFAVVASDAVAQTPSPTQPPAPSQTTPGSGPAPTVKGQGTSSSQTSDPESIPNKTQREKATDQIKEQEHQRVLGILPAFNTSYRGDAVSLTAKEKVSLAFRSAVDPVAFATAFVVAGLHEGLDDEIEFGWGADGYGKRAGAAYLDAFNGTMIGNGVLPALLHQDPRYFRLGHGSATHRLLYAASTSIMCKHDNTGKWEPNYSNVLGNIASGAISNLYYPSNQEGFSQTITTGMIVTAEGTFGAVFQEFWPDLSRRFLHKDPTHGLDSEARTADRAAKQAKAIYPPSQPRSGNHEQRRRSSTIPANIAGNPGCRKTGLVSTCNS